MSTLRLTPSCDPSPASPSSDGWIWVEDAAEIKQCNLRHLRRLCGDRYSKEGLARLEKKENGQTSWQIHRSADPVLAKVKFPEQLSKEFDLRPFTDDQRREILRREQIVLDWKLARDGAAKLQFNENQVAERFLLKLEAEGMPLCRATLFNWLAGYRREGRAGLVDKRWQATRADEISDDPFFEFLKQLYLTPRKLKLAQCHIIAEQKAIEEGWRVHSLHACRRFIKKLPPQLIVKMREGEKAYNDKCAPYIQRDYSQLASNDIWCGDDHRFDVMIRHGTHADGSPKFVRPWASGWMDVRSRKLVGFSIYAHDPNADTILEAFETAAVANGLPRKVQVDNGKTYDAKALQGVTKKQRRAGVELCDADKRRVGGAFTLMRISVQHVQPYHGQSKPIERMFGTLCQDFSRQWETYCGNTPFTRPEDLKDQLDLGKAPTLEEFTAAFAEWAEYGYNGKPHSGDGVDGQHPEEAFIANLHSKRTLPEEMIRFFCMPRVGPVKVGRHGVTHKGLNYGGFEASVQKLFGQQIYLGIDRKDAGRVLILDSKGRLVCQAKLNTKIGFAADGQTVRDMLSEKNKGRKALKEYVKRRPAMAADNHQLLRAAAARRALDRKNDRILNPDPPPTICPVQTPFDDQFETIKKAVSKQPLRLAVGAEFVDQDQLDALRPQRVRTEALDPDSIDVFGALQQAARERGNP